MTISLVLSPVPTSTDDLDAVDANYGGAVVAQQECRAFLAGDAQLAALPTATAPVALGAQLGGVKASPMWQRLTPATSQRPRMGA